MNWLEHHLRSFVFPVLKEFQFSPYDITLSDLLYKTRPPVLWKQANLKQRSLLAGAPDYRVYKTLPFYDKEVRVASGDWSSREAGMLYTVMHSFNLRVLLDEDLSRFRKFSLTASDIFHNVLNQHGRQTEFTREDTVHSIIKNSVKTFRNILPKGNKVILLGRDVWLWAVMCEKMGVPYVYEGCVSRDVAHASWELAKVLAPHQLNDGDILFDTGFAGTIYNCVKTTFPTKQLTCKMFSAHENELQLYKHHGQARNKALFIEYLPKYFESGRCRRIGTDVDYVAQPLSDFSEFIDAALLTAWAWNAESPAWIPGPPNKSQVRNKGGATHNFKLLNIL